MSDIIENTYKLLDALDNSDLIKNLTTAKRRLEQNPEILSLIKEYQKETDSNKLISIKQILYQDEDYRKYIESYNELSLIILRINKQYQKYTNTAEHNCH
ncbi:MAG: YlbF family regulator [Bacilli bacterium]